MLAWLFLTAVPFAASTWTSRPGLPCPVGAAFISRSEMFVSPASLYDVRLLLSASPTISTLGGTSTAARCVLAVRFGPITVGVHATNQTLEFICW